MNQIETTFAERGRIVLLQIMLLVILLIPGSFSVAQRVGIGTNSPLRKLSIDGSVMIDQNSNNTGTLDSVALVFGNAGIVGISSRQSGPEPKGLSLWTGGVAYMNLSPLGNLGVGGGYNAAYRLWVRNGHTRMGGDAYVDGNVSADGSAAFGGNVDPDYRLRVWGGNTRFGGDMHATGNVGIGGLADNNFRLRVYNGESYFGGSMQVTGHSALTSLGVTGNLSTNATITAGNVVVNNSLSIGGNGSVRSNGPSPLRIGFDSKTVDINLVAAAIASVNTTFTEFTGNNDDVRVFVSQIRANAGNTISLANININVTDIDAATNTCTLSIRNLSSLGGTLKATIFLTTIAKN